MERGADLVLVEIKSSQTPAARFFSAFERFSETLAGCEAPRIAGRLVIYGGDESQARSQGRLLSWRDLDSLDWTGGGGGERWPGKP